MNTAINAPKQPKARLLEIDRAKGLAIFLVVLGHIVAGQPPEGNRWFSHVITIIYSFHMPFFMYLSGFVMLYSYKRIESIAAYWDYVWSKTKRLAPGFLLFALIILLGKILSSRFLHVDNMPPDFWRGLIDILVVPGESSAKTLWFIYVLLELYIVFPILMILTGGRYSLIITVALILHFVPATRVFMIADLFEYLVYFAIGACIASRFQSVERAIDRYGWIFLGLFVASISLVYVEMSQQLAKLLIGTLSIPALHFMIRMSPLSGSKLLLQWGLLSYAIYLMNTIAIGFSKGMIFQFTSWDYLNFLWVAPVLVCAGLYVPILVKLYVFPRIGPLDRITN
ncbi:MAG: acyltransferase [Pseudomonadales bacterium]